MGAASCQGPRVGLTLAAHDPCRAPVVAIFPFPQSTSTAASMVTLPTTRGRTLSKSTTHRYVLASSILIRSFPRDGKHVRNLVQDDTLRIGWHARDIAKIFSLGLEVVCPRDEVEAKIGIVSAAVWPGSSSGSRAL